MVGVRIANWVECSCNRRYTGTPAVDDEQLSVRKVHELRHDTRFEHMLNDPSGLDTFFGQSDTTALIGRRCLAGDLIRLQGVADVSPATDKDLRGEIRRREREQDSSAIKRVGNANTIRKVRQYPLISSFDVVYDRLIICNHENFAIWEQECSKACCNCQNPHSLQLKVANRGNKFAGRVLFKNADGLGTPPSLGGKNSMVLAASLWLLKKSVFT